MLTENILDPSGSIIASKRFDQYDGYYFYDYDYRGSTTAIIAPNGTLVKAYTYNEYGKMQETIQSTFNNEVTFTSSVTDESTGLQYMNSRFYNPNTGRFLSEDSYSGNAFEPLTQHLYTYCGDNPVNYIDPTGHIAEKGMGGGYKYTKPLKPEQIVSSPAPLECPWLKNSEAQIVLKKTESLHSGNNSGNKTSRRKPSDPKGKDIIVDDKHGTPVTVPREQPVLDHIYQNICYGDRDNQFNIVPGLHNNQVKDIKDRLNWSYDNIVALKLDINKDVPWWSPNENEARMDKVTAVTEYAVFAWDNDETYAYGSVYYGVYDNGIEVIFPDSLNGAAPPRIYNGGWDVSGIQIPKGYY